MSKNLPNIDCFTGFVLPDVLQNRFPAKYNGSKGKEMTSQCDVAPGTWNGISDYFENIIEIPFEDTFFYGPEGYDLFLTNGYGDYMQLPPEEKRGNQHLVEKLEFGK